MNILGLHGWKGGNNIIGWVHDAGASLFVDGSHVSSIAEERLTRIKADGEYPHNSIQYVLKEGGIETEEVDVVCYTKNMHTYGSRYMEVLGFLREEFPSATVLILDHHLAHAAASFYTSPFNKASIYTQDGGGNMSNSIVGASNTGTYSLGTKEAGIELIRDFVDYSDKERGRLFNLGQIYNFVSCIVLESIGALKEGEDINHPEFLEQSAGKVMGLAAYGNHRNISVPNIFQVEYDGFQFPIVWADSKGTVLQKLQEGEPSGGWAPEDLAAWIQHQYKRVLLEYFGELGTKRKHLCMGGGCALNVLTNRALIDEGIFEDVHVFPGTSDSGLAFGSAIHGAVIKGETLKLPSNLAFLGREYTNVEIEEAIYETFKM